MFIHLTCIWKHNQLTEPGCIGRNEGRIQNSGGIGLHPHQSNTPSIYRHKIHTCILVYESSVLNIRDKWVKQKLMYLFGSKLWPNASIFVDSFVPYMNCDNIIKL
jgi:hypothetical protein